MNFMHGSMGGAVERAGFRYVFCLGMYRSCSTWQYEIVGHLVETHLRGGRLGFIEGIHFDEIPDRGLPSDCLKVLKTHDVHPIFVRELEAGRALPIYSFRDLRDVVFSFMHKAALEFDELIGQGFIEKVLANDSYWRTLPGLFSQRYEDVVANDRHAVAQLTRRLGIVLSVPEIDRLANDYSWNANLKRTREVKRKAEEAGLDLGDHAHIFEHDPHTLLHWNHLREGKRKGWRELASERQREILADLCGDWLIANGYETDNSWVTAEPQASGSVRMDRGEVQARPSRWFGRVWPKVAQALTRVTR